MELFPFFMDVADKTCLIVGGGSVAKEKIESLKRFAVRFLVVAKQTEIAQTASICVERRAFEDADVARADFVVCATNDRALNRHICALCKAQQKPVNVVDDAELCTFVMPSIVKRGDLLVAVSTSGKSPAMASALKTAIEQMLPEHIEDILDRMGELRAQIPSVIKTQQKRKRFYREILQKLIETDNALSEQELWEAASAFAETL